MGSRQVKEKINPFRKTSSARSEQAKKNVIPVKPNMNTSAKLKRDANNLNKKNFQSNVLSNPVSDQIDTTEITKTFCESESTTRSTDVAVSVMKNGGLTRIYGEDRQRVFRLGETASGCGRNKDLQDFTSLREQCLAEGCLFEDPDFPAVDTSIYFSKEPDMPLQWLRPSEIAADPQLYVDDFSRFDVQQGDLGDCWLVAAVATLHEPSLRDQVVPKDQTFDDKYAGIFHFRFWRYGRWVDVVIDDRLPTEGGKLVFLHSTVENEFWGALLEKAYAKLHGSYEALERGNAADAMKDFTGGITELYHIKDAELDTLYEIIIRGHQQGSLIGCAIAANPEVREEKTDDGLVRGHAYSVTGVCYVDTETSGGQDRIPLLRMRNPWGCNAEWRGAWGDESPEWNSIAEATKEEIGLTVNEDGEFWISYEDFTAHFSKLNICNPCHNDAAPTGCKKRLHMTMIEGEWVRDVTAGGSKKSSQTYSQNPQYKLTLTDPDENDDDGLCTVIVALMQKNRRSQYSKGLAHLFIGFSIYELLEPYQEPLQQEFFISNKVVAKYPTFVNMREISCRFKLPPGTYCIVPCTYKPNEEAEFFLQLFTEAVCTLTENEVITGVAETDDAVNYISEAASVPKDSVRKFFLKRAGEDGELDWLELKKILDYAMKKEKQGRGFSKEICRSMVAMMDSDGSGKLGYEEFKTLWTDIQKQKAVFRRHDTGKAGRIPVSLLRDALRSTGYTLNNRTLSILVHRYSSGGYIAFDDFIMCAVRLKTMIDSFYASKELMTTHTATFTFEDWLRRTIYS